MNDNSPARRANCAARHLPARVCSLRRICAQLAALAIGSAALLPVAPAHADTASVQQVVRATGKPGRLETASIQTTATVEKIDHQTRRITLKTSDGRVVALDAGPEIKRLDEIKAGDLLEVEYLESVAIAVQQPGEQDDIPDGAYSVLVRNPTASPSGKLIDTETVSATVEAIDLEKRIVELVRADGSHVRIPVAPDVKRLDAVRKGDTVTVKSTRSVALSIHRPVAQ